MQVDRATAERHYAEHREKPFFGGLVDFITSRPLVAMALDGPNAIQIVRDMNGKTKPFEAAPGTIRGDFALETAQNIVHASDGAEAAARELDLWFKSDELLCTSARSIDGCSPRPTEASPSAGAGWRNPRRTGGQPVGAGPAGVTPEPAGATVADAPVGRGESVGAAEASGRGEDSAPAGTSVRRCPRAVPRGATPGCRPQPHLEGRTARGRPPARERRARARARLRAARDSGRAAARRSPRSDAAGPAAVAGTPRRAMPKCPAPAAAGPRPASEERSRPTRTSPRRPPSGSGHRAPARPGRAAPRTQRSPARRRSPGR